MVSIADRFAWLRARDERALVLFVTAGDPSLEDLPEILLALVEGGADLIEVGIPFSDPFGEGPTIQASSQRSLDRGTTPRAVLDVLRGIPLPIPMVTMGYVNPVLRYGWKAYANASAEAGVAGTILSDLVPDEADAWDAASEEAGISTIYLAAPTSTDARIHEVARRSTGFVYAVSRTGVTGAGQGQEVPPEVRGLVSRIKEHTEKPVCVGFGVSRPEHVRMVCEVADGAVVGSWLVDLLAREWDSGRGRAKVVAAVRELKAATR